MNTGKMIFITGLFGAGKSTLISAAIENIADIHYVMTYTTRPQRSTEINGKGEYTFVNNDEYFVAKNKSKKWDEYIINNYYYGVDVEQINKELDQDKNFIFCVPPDVNMIAQMNKAYKGTKILVWVDTEINIANDRLIKIGRPERTKQPLQISLELPKVRASADILFTPQYDLEEDKIGFIALVQDIISDTIKT